VSGVAVEQNSQINGMQTNETCMILDEALKIADIFAERYSRRSENTVRDYKWVLHRLLTNFSENGLSVDPNIIG